MMVQLLGFTEAIKNRPVGTSVIIHAIAMARPNTGRATRSAHSNMPAAIKTFIIRMISTDLSTSGPTKARIVE